MPWINTLVEKWLLPTVHDAETSRHPYICPLLHQYLGALNESFLLVISILKAVLVPHIQFMAL